MSVKIPLDNIGQLKFKLFNVKLLLLKLAKLALLSIFVFVLSQLVGFLLKGCMMHPLGFRVIITGVELLKNEK